IVLYTFSCIAFQFSTAGNIPSWQRGGEAGCSRHVCRSGEAPGMRKPQTLRFGNGGAACCSRQLG
ncbi:hypothetical protein KZ307_25560, partial [Escherichia coli]|uniref:hypothetical protein n=1 Tax=Escherichia coli TaxID=562 RepID=UPI001EDAED8F